MAISTTNLISVWELKEASGNALDSFGSNTLTDNNTVGAAAGKILGSRDFEAGNTEYFERTDNTDLSTGDIDFTITCWLNLESVGTCGIVTKGPYNSGSDSEYWLGITNIGSGNRFVWDVRASAFANNFVQASNYGAISTGTWVFVVAWHDSVNDLIGIQVNNGTANTTSYTSGVRDGTQPFRLGFDTSSYYDGKMEQVSFWKRILTTQEKTDLYNSGNGLAYSSWAGGGSGGTYSRRLFNLFKSFIKGL